MMFQDWLACGNVQPPLDLPADLEHVALQEYLLDASKPLHTHFILTHRGKRSTCPVYFGNAGNKQTVLNTICNEMHAKIQQQSKQSVPMLSQDQRGKVWLFSVDPPVTQTQLCP